MTASVPLAPVPLRDRAPAPDDVVRDLRALGLISGDGPYEVTELGRNLVELVDQTVLAASLTLVHRRPDGDVRGGEMLVYRAPTRLAIGLWSGSVEDPALTLIEPVPEAAVAMVHRFVDLVGEPRLHDGRPQGDVAPPAPPFEPTHVVRPDGADAHQGPGPATPVVGHLAGATMVRLLDRRAGWAEVVGADGSHHWVDEADLVASEGGWSPSHRVGEGGTPARPRPDPSAPPSRVLEAGTQVRVVETVGAWARIGTEDGWEGWVDGRLLLTV